MEKDKKEKRIFVAIPISQNFQKEILSRGKDFQMINRRVKARWLTGKNLHITLIPPWHIKEEETENIKNILEDVARKFRPFKMNFEKISFGSDMRNPRLIWVEGKTPKEIIELKNLLEQALYQKSERKTFLLHITIARFRPEDFYSFQVENLNERVDWQEEAKSIVLMESHLFRDGAEYEILSEAKLYST